MLHTQPSRRPHACGTNTGYPAAESHLVVRRNGAVVFTPAVLPSGPRRHRHRAGPAGDSDSQSNASPGAMAVTKDRGAHWQRGQAARHHVEPDRPRRVRRPGHRPAVLRGLRTDPARAVVRCGAGGPGPHQLDRRHASTGTTRRSTGIDLPENPRFTSGRAPPGQSKPNGYRDVVYFCANTNVGFVSPVIAGRACFRSLDGGSRLGRRAVLFTGAAPAALRVQRPGRGLLRHRRLLPAGRPGRLALRDGRLRWLDLPRPQHRRGGDVPTRPGQTGPVTLPVRDARPGDVGGTPELRITDDGTFVLAYRKATS